MGIGTSNYDINQEDYFGISLLDLGSYGGRVMAHSLYNPSHSALFFREADMYYNHSERALTVEGLADSPAFAIQALEAHATSARQLEEPKKP